MPAAYEWSYKSEIASRVWLRHLPRAFLILSALLVVADLGLSADLVSAQNTAPKSMVTLTPEEIAWLKAHPDIQLGFTGDFEPHVIINPDGTYRGLLVDFLDELNKRLGTRIALRTDSILIFRFIYPFH